jgi:hypothetical protein
MAQPSIYPDGDEAPLVESAFNDALELARHTARRHIELTSSRSKKFAPEILLSLCFSLSYRAVIGM